MLILAEAAGFEAFVGRLHPLLLHFPIALLIFAALLETGRWVIGKREHASISAATCLVFGTLLCVLTVWAGWELAEHESETGVRARTQSGGQHPRHTHKSESRGGSLGAHES